MAEANYVERRYENLGCWDKEIHGNCLEWLYTTFRLYPRGLNGNGEHMVVKVWDLAQSSRVDLSFIGADGSLICKQEVKDPEWEEELLTLPPGPRFEDYVRTITSKDVLTLRLYLSDNSLKDNGCTTIDVVERFLKIPTLLFKNKEIVESLGICTLNYNKGDQHIEFDLYVCVGGSKEDEISILFSRDSKSEKFLIHACVSLLDCHDVVMRKSKDCKNFFGDDLEWTLPTTFLLKEVKEKECYMSLCFKIVSKDIQNTREALFLEYAECSSMKPFISSEKSSKSQSLNILSQELMSLYQDQDFSDFQLICGNISFPVHRAILSARSPVFKSMLSCSMQEAATGRMDMVDMDPSTLTLFLAFLYTGKVDEDLQWDIAFRLYYAADKYQIPTLNRECSDFLCAKVSLSNVCDVLSLADKHQDDRLTSVAHDFILDNFSAVLCSKEWKSFMVKESLLGVKTLTVFAEQTVLRVVHNS